MFQNLEDAKINWITHLRDQVNCSENTVIAYKNDLDDFLRFLSEYLGNELTLKIVIDSDIRTFRSWLAYRFGQKKAASSSARAVASLRNFYRFLMYHSCCQGSKIFSIKTPKKAILNPKALSVDDTLECIAHLSSKKSNWTNLRDESLLTLIYGTGCRISEALSITKNHLKEDALKITGKGRKQRLIPILPMLRSKLNQYIEQIPFVLDNDQPIFIGKLGKPLHSGTFRVIIQKMRQALGLPKSVTPHVFRNSFATHLLNNGANLRAIQELLGHVSLSSTQKYTKVELTHLKKAYESHPFLKNTKKEILE